VAAAEQAAVKQDGSAKDVTKAKEPPAGGMTSARRMTLQALAQAAEDDDAAAQCTLGWW